MGLLETILCALLELHDYSTDREQNDTGYVKKTCARCGHSTFEPR